MKSLSKIILLVAALVSLLMVLGAYLLFSGFGDRMMQKAALSQSQIVARLTFSNMHQLMDLGWKRDQVIAFSRGATNLLVGTPLKIDVYRGELVDQLHGVLPQAAIGDELARVLRSKRPREIATDHGGRYIYPLLAEEKCLGCHDNAGKGDVLGAITVEARYDSFIDDSLKLLMLVMLMLAPMPFIATWLVTLYLDSRINRFVHRVDAALDAADGAGGSPDFSQVKPSWHELNDILERFKRLAGRPR